jgi:ferredoxin--NADP+ reductase
MYKVYENKQISPDSYLMEIEAPLAVKKAIPGQFVIVMAKEDSERIPLTIYDYNQRDGILKIIYQVIGASTEELTYVKDELFSVAGPLGNANEICADPEKFRGKRICYVAGGLGIAPVYPQVKFLHKKGFKIDVIYGSRQANMLLIRDKIEKVVNKISYCTDDGSFGTHGFVTDVLEKNIHHYDIVVAIGPIPMMKAVAEVTKKYNKKCIVSMNPLMVDGSGMCGACRCEIEGKPKFACVDGPEFDGHQVNFDLAMKRMKIYKEEEALKWEEMKKRLAKEKK